MVGGDNHAGGCFDTGDTSAAIGRVGVAEGLARDDSGVHEVNCGRGRDGDNQLQGFGLEPIQIELLHRATHEAGPALATTVQGDANAVEVACGAIRPFLAHIAEKQGVGGRCPCLNGALLEGGDHITAKQFDVFIRPNVADIGGDVAILVGWAAIGAGEGANVLFVAGVAQCHQRGVGRVYGGRLDI